MQLSTVALCHMHKAHGSNPGSANKRKKIKINLNVLKILLILGRCVLISRLLLILILCVWVLLPYLSVDSDDQYPSLHYTDRKAGLRSFLPTLAKGKAPNQT